MTEEPNSHDGTPKPESALDADLQKEVDEALGELSMEELIAQEQGTAPTPVSSTPDQNIRTGTVLAIQGKYILVEMGPKRQGILAVGQFVDEPLPEPGAIIEFTVEGFDPAEQLSLLSRQGAVMAAAWQTLKAGQIVEGLVTGHNKGGLELNINGIRAFMPVSQIEMFRVEDLTVYRDKRLRAEVIELDVSQKNLVVSQRAVRQREAEEAKERLLSTISEGKTVHGAVKTIVPFGAFVDLGGVDGLLHVSQMAHRHVADPNEIVSVGQKLELMVLKYDQEQNRISLGLKQVLPDPWQQVEQQWSEGQVINGTVRRLAEFGAFVELAPGVEGLIHIGQLSHERVRSVSDVLKTGQTVAAKIVEIDQQRRRIGLSIKQLTETPPSAEPQPEADPIPAPRSVRRKKPLKGGLD